MGQKEHQYGHLYSAVWHYANSFTPTESPQTCSELLTTAYDVKTSPKPVYSVQDIV